MGGQEGNVTKVRHNLERPATGLRAACHAPSLLVIPVLRRSKEKNQLKDDRTWIETSSSVVIDWMLYRPLF